MPSLSPRPPSPRQRGVCVRCSQPPGKGTARVWLSQRGLVGAVGGTVYGGARSRNGDGSHGNSRLLSQRSRSVLRERWLRCSDTVRGFRPGHVPLWVPDITARFRPGREVRPPGLRCRELLRTPLRRSSRSPIAQVRRACLRRGHNTGRYYQCLMYAGHTPSRLYIRQPAA
jgi:hypothetical protein